MTLSCQLSSSKLVAKARNETLFITQKLFLFLCVCVTSHFDLSITKQNYLFVRCQFLSHIPNTSLRCSNQPLWKLNLMTGVNMTISLKKFVFSNVALVHVNLVPRIFYRRKKPAKNTIFTNFFIR